MRACIRLCVLCAWSLFAAAAPAQEPVEQGKTLSQWVVLLTDEEPSIRQDACLALANLRQDAVVAVPALTKALTDDPDPGVRTYAAMSLGLMGAAAADILPALEAAASASTRCRPG